MLPIISIVTPSFNQGQFIEKTICSVLDQNYPNLEYVVIDGGSTDETVEIIKKYEKHLTYWVSEPDRGQSHAINKGLAHCTGDIFNWLNSDDYLEKGALFSVSDAWKENPEASVWLGATYRLHDTGFLHYISYPNGLWAEHFCLTIPSCCLYQPSCFMNMKYVRELDCVDESLIYSMDVDLYLKLFKKGVFYPGKGIWSTALAHPYAKTVCENSQSFVEISSTYRRHGFEEGANVAMERSKRIVQPYTMPRSLRKKMNTLLFSKKITKETFETPFSFDQRNLITLVSNEEKISQEYLAFLKSCFQEILHRFPYASFNLIHREYQKIEEMVTLPNVHYAQDPFALLEKTKIFIILKRNAQVDMPRMNRAGIPVVITPELATHHGLVNGESCFTADNSYDMIFKSILLYLNHSVWGNISTQSILHGHADKVLGKLVS